MRRVLAILILCLLPLQWSFAAMADYCRHETTAAGQHHAGHHSHKHVDDGHRDKKEAGGYGDRDCPTCQHAPVANLTFAPVTFPPEKADAVIDFASRIIPSRSPDNPFRPPHLA